MRPVANLLAEARALGLLRSLPGDAAAMALAFAALAGVWIATPPTLPEPSSGASPVAAPASLATAEEAGGSIGDGR